MLSRPVVPGHEMAGVVEAGPLAGTAVGIDPAVPCGRCPSCLRGHRNLCPTVGFAGHGTLDGALRELIAWPTHLLHRLPSSLSTTDGAVLEPLGVAIHALDLGHLRPACSIAVVGCGPEVDVAFEVAGNDDAVGLALLLVRPGGRVVLAGIPDDDRTSFPASLARRKGVTIALVRRTKEDVYERGVALVETGRVDKASLVTSRFPLAEAAQAFDVAAARHGLKVIIQP